MLRALILLALVGAGCANKAKAPGSARNPSQTAGTEVVLDHSGMDHGPLTPEFIKTYNTDARRHTFIQLFDDLETLAQGTFGYHISEFGSNHQHQLIVRADNLVVGRDFKASLPLIKGTFSKKAPSGFYSVTTDGPKQGFRDVLLKEIINQTLPQVPTDLFDGILVKRIKAPWLYDVKSIVFTTPLQLNDIPLDKNIYIVFGLLDDEKPKKKYFMAHLIWGFENNFDQLIAVEFDSAQVIPNGKLMVIDDSAIEPLKVGSSYQTFYDAGPKMRFKVTREIRKQMIGIGKPKN